MVRYIGARREYEPEEAELSEKDAKKLYRDFETFLRDLEGISASPVSKSKNGPKPYIGERKYELCGKNGGTVDLRVALPGGSRGGVLTRKRYGVDWIDYPIMHVSVEIMGSSGLWDEGSGFSDKVIQYLEGFGMDIDENNFIKDGSRTIISGSRLHIDDDLNWLSTD